MAPSDLVPAAWNGPFEGDLGPGTAPVKTGDVHEVSPEMLESGHWVAVEPAALPATSSTSLSAPRGATVADAATSDGSGGDA